MSKVYILKCEDKYKIGVTSGSIATRIKQLQTGNPSKIVLEEAYSLYNLSYYYEKYFHKMYNHCRLTGEWFMLTDIELSFLKLNLKYQEDNINIVTTEQGKLYYTEQLQSVLNDSEYFDELLAELANLKFKEQ